MAILLFLTPRSERSERSGVRLYTDHFKNLSVRPSVRPSVRSFPFFSQTTGPISTKFCMSTPIPPRSVLKRYDLRGCPLSEVMEAKNYQNTNLGENSYSNHHSYDSLTHFINFL